MFNKMFKEFRKDNRGFTLVELMVVVVIIGVLTAIAIPVYNASTAKAEKGACEANLRMLDSAIQQYKMLDESTDTLTTENLEDKLKSYFSDGIPRCPSAAEDSTGLTYKIVDNHAECTIKAEHKYRNSDTETGD